MFKGFRFGSKHSSVARTRSNSRRARLSIEELENRVVPTGVLPFAADGDANDQIAEAVFLGAMSLDRTRLDSINTGIDVDMFRFSVTAGQRIRFDVDRPSGNLDSFLRLFDATGVELANNDDGPTPGEAATTESFIEFTFANAGSFFVGVSGFPNGTYDPVSGAGDAAGSSTGAYRLNLTRVGGDPNDTLAEAANLGALTQARTVTDSINVATDVDLFSFTVTAGQRITFDIDRPSGSQDSFLRLFNAQGTQLASNDDGPTPGEANSVEAFLDFTFTTGGTFFVGVSGFPNTNYNPLTGAGDATGSIGAYRLTLTPVGDLDDQIAEAVSLGAMTQTRTATGAIDLGTDVDMFSFTVTAGQRVTIDVDRPSGSLDSFLRLFDANGTELAVNDDGPTPGEANSVESFLDLTFNVGGTFFLGVSGFGNGAYDPLTGNGDLSGSTGAYALTLALVVVAPPPPPASAFDIELTFTGLSASQIAIFNQAAVRWEEIIVGDLPDVTFNGQAIDDVLIAASGVFIDGVSNVLGQAAPDAFRIGSGLPAHGFMEFDTADLANMEANGTLFEVILHEMGHVLGVGTIWDDLNLLTGAGTANPRFLGAQATAAFNQIFGVNQTSVPVEGNNSPVGSRDSHWRESLFGNELMSPRIASAGNPISLVTVASLADLGYTVNLNAADAYTPPASVAAPSSGGTASGAAGLTGFASVGLTLLTERLQMAFAGLAMDSDLSPSFQDKQMPGPAQPSAAFGSSLRTDLHQNESALGRPMGLASATGTADLMLSTAHVDMLMAALGSV